MDSENLFSVLKRTLSSGGHCNIVYLESWKKLMHENSLDETIVSFINSHLSTTEKCWIGLKLLDIYLEEANIASIERKIYVWSNLLLRKFSSEQECSIIFKILGKLAIRCTESSRVERIFIVNYLPKIYALLNEVPSSQLQSAIRCCEICLKHFRQDSGPFKADLEQFFREHITCTNEDTGIYIGKCLHLLQSVRNKNDRNQSEQWGDYLQQLLNSIHCIFDNLYSKYSNHFKCTDNLKPLLTVPDASLSSELTEKYAQLYIQYRNLINYLIIAIRDPFPVKKPFRLQMILDVVVRGLSVTNVMFAEFPTTECMVLEPILPKIHLNLLNLLNVFIITVKFNLRPCSSILNRLLVNTLKWTTNWKSKGNSQEINSLRSKVYETISLWCKTMKTGSRIEVVVKELLFEIYADIIIDGHINSTKILSKPDSRKSAKHHFKLNQTDEIKEKSKKGSWCSVEITTDKDSLIVSALTCLHSVLESAFLFMDSAVIKTLYIKIFTLSTQLLESRAFMHRTRDVYFALYNILYFLLATPNIYTAHFKSLLCKYMNLATFHAQNTAIPNMSAVQRIETIIHPIKDGLLYPNCSNLTEDNINEMFSKVEAARTFLNFNNHFEEPNENTSTDNSIGAEQEIDMDICSESIMNESLAKETLDNTEKSYKSDSEDPTKIVLEEENCISNSDNNEASLNHEEGDISSNKEALPSADCDNITSNEKQTLSGPDYESFSMTSLKHFKNPEKGANSDEEMDMLASIANCFVDELIE